MEYNLALTTFDNPYDPFDDFTSWSLFDIEKHYNSSGYLMRIAKIEEDMTQKEVDEEIERAIDEIIKYDFRNVYKKLKKELKNSAEAQETT